MSELNSLSAPLQVLEYDNTLTEEEVTEKIAFNLNEPNKELIYKIVKTVGIERTLLVYNQTIKIQEEGGIQREDKKGKKTPGGVFFYVIYHNSGALSDNLRQIFSEDAHKKEKERRNQIKEERRKKTELLKAQFIKEGLLSNNTVEDKK